MLKYNSYPSLTDEAPLTNKDNIYKSKNSEEAPLISNDDELDNLFECSDDESTSGGILSNISLSAIVFPTSPDKLSLPNGFLDVRSTTEVFEKSIFKMLFSITTTSSTELIMEIIPIDNNTIIITADTIPTIVDKIFLNNVFIMYNFEPIKIRNFKEAY